MNLKIQITQAQAEKLLSQLYRKDEALKEAFESPDITVEIVPNFFREKLNLIRFFRDGVRKVIAEEIESVEGIPTLGGTKSYVEKYFNLP